jgi:hypothetical protein
MINLTSKRVGKTLKTIDVKMKLIPRVPLSMVRCNAPVCRLLNNSSMVNIHKITHNKDPKTMCLQYTSNGKSDPGCANAKIPVTTLSVGTCIYFESESVTTLWQ